MSSSYGEANSDCESDDLKRYLPLYKAALSGDWETAKRFFNEDKYALTAAINNYKETPLHVSVLSRKSIDFVRKLVDMLPPEDLAIEDCAGNTALHIAGQVGNTEAAKILVTKNPDLLFIKDDNGNLPVRHAAIFNHRLTVEYLLSKSEHPFESQSGVDVLITLIYSRYLDVALDFVVKYPELARMRSEKTHATALLALAEIDKYFLSGERFNWWERWIHHRIPLKQPKLEVADQFTSNFVEIESGIRKAPMYNKVFFSFCGVSEKLEFMLCKVIRRLVPKVEEISRKKAVHQKALALVERLCQEMLALPHTEANSMFCRSIIKAAKCGISEVVEVIMDVFPFATYARDGDTYCTIFLLAAKYRFEKVFNLLHSLSDRKYRFFDNTDIENNNLMHVCAKLAPSNRLNLVPGAALQMQRELQWYHEMEMLVHPSRHMLMNNQEQIPNMLFTEEHRQLKVDGERWMKDTANACSISAALIATVMFAAVFTVPGGVDKGIPIFSSKVVFLLFAISDAISFFTSITSLLMFVSILTARYAEQDFLYVLPKRLIIGLLSLFISITFMMVAYSAAMSFVIKMNHPWYLIPMATLACLPVTSFVLLQFPLLVEVVYSTYGPGIFVRKK